MASKSKTKNLIDPESIHGEGELERRVHGTSLMDLRDHLGRICNLIVYKWNTNVMPRWAWTFYKLMNPPEGEPSIEDCRMAECIFFDTLTAGERLELFKGWSTDRKPPERDEAIAIWLGSADVMPALELSTRTSKNTRETHVFAKRSVMESELRDSEHLTLYIPVGASQADVLRDLAAIVRNVKENWPRLICVPIMADIHAFPPSSAPKVEKGVRRVKSK